MRPGEEDTAEKYTASLCQKSAVLRDRQQVQWAILHPGIEHAAYLQEVDEEGQ